MQQMGVKAARVAFDDLAGEFHEGQGQQDRSKPNEQGFEQRPISVKPMLRKRRAAVVAV